MKIKEIIKEIEAFAPLPLQEEYDNSGLQVGDVNVQATGVLLCLDVTEDVVEEAIELECNLIISHHPLIFKPLKSLTGRTYIERSIQKACKHDIVIYAAHTNLDNAPYGVSYKIAEKIGLQNIRVLSPLPAVHLYEEPASDHYPLANMWSQAGSGVVGELPLPEDELVFLQHIKSIFRLNCLKHSPVRNRSIKDIAVCGGSGAFLIPKAIASGADVFITGEAKYNDYYDVEDRILLAAIGHYESEVCTKEIFFDIITKKNINFAVHFSSSNVNPVNYL